MSNKDPNYVAMLGKPGNTLVLGMVDHGWYDVSIFYRTWILLNRNYSNVAEGKVFWLHNVIVRTTLQVVGSSKMGIPLYHPVFQLSYSGFTAPVTQNSCFLRVDIVKTAPAPNLLTATIAWLSPNGLPGDPNGRALGPVFIPRDLPKKTPIRTSCTF